MEASPIIVGVLIGIAVGFPGGVLYASARRAWTDLSGARKAIPVARRIGTNGPFAGLNITTTSGRLRTTAWIVETAVCVSVSSAFDRIAGRFTSSIPQ